MTAEWKSGFYLYPDFDYWNAMIMRHFLPNQFSVVLENVHGRSHLPFSRLLIDCVQFYDHHRGITKHKTNVFKSYLQQANLPSFHTVSWPLSPIDEVFLGTIGQLDCYISVECP